VSSITTYTLVYTGCLSTLNILVKEDTSAVGRKRQWLKVKHIQLRVLYPRPPTTADLDQTSSSHAIARKTCEHVCVAWLVTPYVFQVIHCVHHGVIHFLLVLSSVEINVICEGLSLTNLKTDMLGQ